MVFWQRILITFIAMLATSFAAGMLWRSIFDAAIPGYLAGIVGGLTAVPVWELLKKIKGKDKK